jgi:hypothetical protein
MPSQWAAGHGWGIKRGRDLRVIALELRRMGDGKTIRSKFRRELKAAAAPLVPAVRASEAAIPVKGTSGSTGLRKALQRATKLMIRTSGRQAGVRILVDPKRMGDYGANMPAMVEGTTPWNHPVFGNRDVWVNRQPPKPYFYKVVNRLGPASRVAVTRVVASITREVT